MLKDRYTTEELSSMTEAQKKQLASEIRTLLIETVSQNGGHLASNLGVVELTIALHSVFSTPRDKILFDVGHQAYVHKMLTGRMEKFSTIRKKDGISGFLRRQESEHDAFATGHASSAISAALGMARAKKNAGEDFSIVAVVGDGALTGGMCYEALNDAGHTGTPLIVVLNDNEMSISKNVGALEAYLTRLRASGRYTGAKRGIRDFLQKIPRVGKPTTNFFIKIQDLLRTVFVGEKFFDSLGFKYYGPIDGHNIREMTRVLRLVQKSTEPVLVHVVTQKGRGYEFAENKPDAFHGVAPFFVESGESVEKGAETSGGVMAREITLLAEDDPRICVVSAAMPVGTGMSVFQERFPDRFYDVGIAEEHAVTMAAGMAAGGMRPYVAIYSTFMQRAYDQIMMDVCLEKLPVTLLLDRGGFVGADGSSHQGVFDLSYLRHIPNLIVASPRDIHDLRRLARLSAKTDLPMAIRYSKEARDMGPGMMVRRDLRIGEWEILSSGGDVMILAVGAMVETALRTSIELLGKGIHCGVVDARFVKPMDDEILRAALDKAPLLVTIEDNVIAGGFGSAVLEKLAGWGIRHAVLTLGVPDCFVEHASVREQMEQMQLTPEAIAQKIIAFSERK